MTLPAVEDRESHRLPILDVMRFVAALCVAAYHLTYRPTYLGGGAVVVHPGLQAITRYGYLGVDLFFLISGFVILWSATGRSPSVYVAARVSRIVPSLWVGIAITSLALVASGKAAEALSFATVLGSMTLVASWVGVPWLDPVYWTLQVEIQLYLVVFLLIALGQMRRIETWLIVWLCGLAYAHLAEAPSWWKAIVIFPYGAYFVGGCLAFLIWRGGLSPMRAAALSASLWLSVGSVPQEAIRFMPNDVTSVTISVARTIVVAFYLLFVMVALRVIGVPRWRGWFELGALTYPLYLVHNEVGKTVAASVARRASLPVALVAGFLAALALAAVMSRTVERRVCPWLRARLLRAWRPG